MSIFSNVHESHADFMPIFLNCHLRIREFFKKILVRELRLANPGGESRTGTRTCMPGEVPPKQDRPFFIKGATCRTVSLPCSILRRRVLWQDPAPEISSGSGANAREYSSFKSVFWQNLHFKREKTVQFSGLNGPRKTGSLAGCPGTRHGPEGHYGRNLKGVLHGVGKNRFFPENAENCQPAFPVRCRRVSGWRDTVFCLFTPPAIGRKPIPEII